MLISLGLFIGITLTALLHVIIVWLLCHAISWELLVEEARLMLVVFVHKVTYMPV